MRINYSTVKSELDKNGFAIVTSKAFNEDMKVLSALSDKSEPINKFAERYLESALHVSKLDITIENDYTTIKLI